MKTKEQILEWLDKQPWKNEFYENHFKHNIGDRISFNENFIRSSFDWPIGGGVWIERENEYLRWYNSNDRPMSWEEYCEQNPLTDRDWCISGNCGVLSCIPGRMRDAGRDANAMSKELCKAFLAYMKLIQLRNAWVRDYDYMNMYHKVVVCNDAPYVKSVHHSVSGLSFPDAMMANEFINTFRDLLKTAKPLI